jgi:hypothetical protein
MTPGWFGFDVMMSELTAHDGCHENVGVVPGEA